MKLKMMPMTINLIPEGTKHLLYGTMKDKVAGFYVEDWEALDDKGKIELYNKVCMSLTRAALEEAKVS